MSLSRSEASSKLRKAWAEACRDGQLMPLMVAVRETFQGIEDRGEDEPAFPRLEEAMAPYDQEDEFDVKWIDLLVKRDGKEPAASILDTGPKERFTDPETGGQKEESLSRFDLVPPDALCELAQVYGYGEGKYPGGVEGPNYLRGYPWHLSVASLERHVQKFKAGEDIDPETGRHHLAHAAWHCFTLIVFGMRELGTDDRVKIRR